MRRCWNKCKVFCKTYCGCKFGHWSELFLTAHRNNYRYYRPRTRNRRQSDFQMFQTHLANKCGLRYHRTDSANIVASTFYIFTLTPISNIKVNCSNILKQQRTVSRYLAGYMIQQNNSPNWFSRNAERSEFLIKSAQQRRRANLGLVFLLVTG